MADVFISYKSERRAAAEHLAEILSDYGYSIWWDYGLVSGRDFGAEIEKELRAAKAVVVLWCSMSVHSEWVREEAALAKRLNRLIPTFIEKNVDLPLGFSLSQTLDLADWDGSPRSAKLDRLLRDVGTFVGRPPKPNMEGVERTERAWRRFGAPPLREFALIEELERTLPPRTLPMTSENAAPAKKRSVPRWLGALVGIVVVIAGGAKLIGAMTLPGCDSSETAQIVREIFKEQTGETVQVSDAKLVSEAGAERSCAAHIASPTETADITYRIYWDGWSKMVQIGEVKSQPIDAAPQG